MFYYLSFLRPPPLSTSHSSAVVFTPQLSNDLRTEHFPSAIDIFYCWLDANSGATLTAPSKLTTWRSANAYKELSIPPPKLRSDARAVLVLTSSPVGGAQEIDLCSPSIGNLPLPVFSMPITFSARPAKGAKQESVQRSFRLFDDAEKPPLCIREMTSFDLDKVRTDAPHL